MNALGDNSNRCTPKKIKISLLYFWDIHLHDFLGPLGSSQSFEPPRIIVHPKCARINRLIELFIEFFNRLLGWSEVGIYNLNRGRKSFRRIVVNFFVISVIEFLRDAEPFKSLLAS